jgi:AraC-like DNA-binding protein
MESELIVAPPDPRLRPHVVDYMGYVERTGRPVRRREIPLDHVSLILELGPPLLVFDAADPDGPSRPATTFVAGLHDSFALWGHDGEMWGVEVRFTPLGAHTFFRLAMHELANGVVSLEDVLGAEARRLAERLAEAPTWNARFALLDAAIAARVADARPVSPSIAWAWRRLVDTSGTAPVGALASELGCSRRHLATGFREQVGLPPKTVARILRFRRAVELLQGSEPGRWAEIAHRCGYYDQAHFNRDFKQLAGHTPTEFLSSPETLPVL